MQPCTIPRNMSHDCSLILVHPTAFERSKTPAEPHHECDSRWVGQTTV